MSLEEIVCQWNLCRGGEVLKFQQLGDGQYAYISLRSCLNTKDGRRFRSVILSVRPQDHPERLISVYLPNTLAQKITDPHMALVNAQRERISVEKRGQDIIWSINPPAVTDE